MGLTLHVCPGGPPKTFRALACFPMATLEWTEHQAGAWPGMGENGPGRPGPWLKAPVWIALSGPLCGAPDIAYPG